MHWRFAIHRYVSLHQASELENLLKTFSFFFSFFFFTRFLRSPTLDLLLNHRGRSVKSSCIRQDPRVAKDFPGRQPISCVQFRRSSFHSVTVSWRIERCGVWSYVFREKQIDWKWYLWTPWCGVIHREKWSFMYSMEENVTGFVEKILKEMLNASLNTLEMIQILKSHY